LANIVRGVAVGFAVIFSLSRSWMFCEHRAPRQARPLAPLVAQYLVRRFSRLRFRNDAQRRMAVARLLAWMAWRKRLPRAMGGSTSRGSQGIPIAFEAREAELVRRIRMQTLAVSQWPQKAQAVLPRRIIALNIISRNAARSMRPKRGFFRPIP
jgi:hypothetical protein